MGLRASVFEEIATENRGRRTLRCDGHVRTERSPFCWSAFRLALTTTVANKRSREGFGFCGFGFGLTHTNQI